MQAGKLIACALAVATAGAFAQPTMKPITPLHPKAPAGARVFIVSPKDGATVGQDVTVKFGASGIKVVPTSNMAPRTGHHHLLIDVDTLPPLGQPIPNDAQHLHFGKGQTQTTIHLTPGDHTLQLDFANFAHMQFEPRLLSRKITIHVK